MGRDHIVSSFDEDLQTLSGKVVRMGGLAEYQLAQAIQAMSKRSPELAERIVRDDHKVDDLEHEIDLFTFRLLALRQPMAGDLREIVSAIRLSVDLERIADIAANIARRTSELHPMPPSEIMTGVLRLGRLVQHIIKDVLDAYLEKSATKALGIWQSDHEVDALYTSLFRELLTYMMEDPRHITPCTHLLFIAKNLERIGDHASNIAELIYFLVEGQNLKKLYGKNSPETTDRQDLERQASQQFPDLKSTFDQSDLEFSS